MDVFKNACRLTNPAVDNVTSEAEHHVPSVDVFPDSLCDREWNRLCPDGVSLFYVDSHMVRVVKAVNVAQDGVRLKMCALHHPHTMADVRVGSQSVLSHRHTKKRHSPNDANRRGHALPTFVRKDVCMTSAHAVGPLRDLGCRKWCRLIASFLSYSCNEVDIFDLKLKHLVF